MTEQQEAELKAWAETLARLRNKWDEYDRYWASNPKLQAERPEDWNYIRDVHDNPRMRIVYLPQEKQWKWRNIDQWKDLGFDSPEAMHHYPSTSAMASAIEEAFGLTPEQFTPYWEAAARPYNLKPDGTYSKWERPGQLMAIANELGNVFGPALTEAVRDEEIRSRLKAGDWVARSGADAIRVLAPIGGVFGGAASPVPGGALLGAAAGQAAGEMAGEGIMKLAPSGTAVYQPKPILERAGDAAIAGLTEGAVRGGDKLIANLVNKSVAKKVLKNQVPAAVQGNTSTYKPPKELVKAAVNPEVTVQSYRSEPYLPLNKEPVVFRLEPPKGTDFSDAARPADVPLAEYSYSPKEIKTSTNKYGQHETKSSVSQVDVNPGVVANFKAANNVPPTDPDEPWKWAANQWQNRQSQLRNILNEGPMPWEQANKKILEFENGWGDVPTKKNASTVLRHAIKPENPAKLPEMQAAKKAYAKRAAETANMKPDERVGGKELQKALGEHWKAGRIGSRIGATVALRPLGFYLPSKPEYE